MSRPIDFSLYLITDQNVLPPGRSLPEAVREALIGGVKCIQLREKELAPKTLLPLARELRGLTREYGAKLFINDRADVALACDADGVHLTTNSLPTTVVRKILGPDKLIGVSTHCTNEISLAEKEGADFVTFGPVFYTASKAAFGPPVGLEKLREACSQTRLPVFALGGVNLPQVDNVMACGAYGVALISAILGFTDARGKTRQFIEQLS
ncbi:MAG: thiamine phosphate synthase [Deltaproteobacteria bacterium]|nr:thiamine phosphate synthase [Deltaproteobacteria bacterium]